MRAAGALPFRPHDSLRRTPGGARAAGCRGGGGSRRGGQRWWLDRNRNPSAGPRGDRLDRPKVLTPRRWGPLQAADYAGLMPCSPTDAGGWLQATGGLPPGSSADATEGRRLQGADPLEAWPTALAAAATEGSPLRSRCTTHRCRPLLQGAEPPEAPTAFAPLAFFSLFPLVYPGGSSQRSARQRELIRWGANSEKLFCMGFSKNRLAATFGPRSVARIAPGGPGAYRGLRWPTGGLRAL